MAIVTINIDSQVPNLTRVTLQALIAGSDLSTQRAYVITDAVGGTKRIVVFATANNALSSLGLNQTDGSVGTYDISTDVYTASAGGSFVPYTGATSDVDLGLHKLLAQTLALNTTTAGTADVGVMAWNDTEGTIEFKLKGGNVTLQLGQEQVARVVNKTGSNLLEANYQCVYVSGAQGQRIKVNLAKADSQTTCENTLGLVTETINNNQEGFITTAGLVNAINTTGALQGETWADGDVLYLSQSTAGQITNVLPSSGIVVVVGYCVHAHATQGKIFVNVNVKLVQPYIPLAGTDSGSPLTGAIETSGLGDVIKNINSGITSALKIEEGVNIRLNSASSSGQSNIIVSPSYSRLDSDDGVGNGSVIQSGVSSVEISETTSSVATAITLLGGTAIISSQNTGFEGAKYDLDYSANFVDRSLVDKAWVLANAGGVTDGDKGDVVVSSSGTVWTVEALQTRPVSNTAPTTGQLLVWNGSAWTPTTHYNSATASPAGALAAGLTRYVPVNGSNAIATGEGSLQHVVPFALTTVNATCYLVITTAIVGTATITLRKNGVDTGLVITIPNGSTTGIFSATGAISFASTDLWSWKLVGATTNSIQVNNITLNYI